MENKIHIGLDSSRSCNLERLLTINVGLLCTGSCRGPGAVGSQEWWAARGNLSQCGTDPQASFGSKEPRLFNISNLDFYFPKRKKTFWNIAINIPPF